MGKRKSGTDFTKVATMIEKTPKLLVYLESLNLLFILLLMNEFKIEKQSGKTNTHTHTEWHCYKPEICGP